MSEISIEDVSKRFEEHLSIEDNNRIIFSGKFGTGKTYFLNNFFDNRPTEYNKLIISPANYVVSSNEDIFELIKADIVKDLFFTNKIELKKATKKTKLQKIELFAGEKPHHLIKFITSSLKKVNPFFEIGDDFYEGLKKLYSEYKTYEKELEKSLQTSEEDLSNFLDSFLDTKGSLFEHDFITKTINFVLERMQEGGNKKNVLVIDDLDRIDPDHIFRILNILSAHNNQFGTDNKFKFDHVIIVCDIDNIRKIFCHKYGTKVDFDGYMDKFYSADYFIYRNLDAINSYIDFFSSEFENEEEKCFAKLIYQALSMRNIITLRKLLKHKIKFSIPEIELLKLNPPSADTRLEEVGKVASKTNLRLLNSDLRILELFKMLSISLGSIQILVETIQSEKTTLLSFIDSATFAKAVCYLSLQNHIANTDDVNYFFHIDGQKNNHGRYIYIKGIGSPRTTLFNVQFTFNTKWNGLTKYDGTSPFFENISFGYNDEQGRLVGLRNSPKEFWDCILQILQVCKSKKYLEKVGIIY